jgi:hypothetical protein
VAVVGYGQGIWSSVKAAVTGGLGTVRTQTSDGIARGPGSDSKEGGEMRGGGGGCGSGGRGGTYIGPAMGRRVRDGALRKGGTRG